MGEGGRREKGSRRDGAATGRHWGIRWWVRVAERRGRASKEDARAVSWCACMQKVRCFPTTREVEAGLRRRRRREGLCCHKSRHRANSLGAPRALSSSPPSLFDWHLRTTLCIVDTSRGHHVLRRCVGPCCVLAPSTTGPHSHALIFLPRASLPSLADETGGIVIDVGAANARFGFAGDDMPKAVFSSVRLEGRRVGPTPIDAVMFRAPVIRAPFRSRRTRLRSPASQHHVPPPHQIHVTLLNRIPSLRAPFSTPCRRWSD
jgi:hypothetical protein